jgi:hypothetical protein
MQVLSKRILASIDSPRGLGKGRLEDTNSAARINKALPSPPRALCDGEQGQSDFEGGAQSRTTEPPVERAGCKGTSPTREARMLADPAARAPVMVQVADEKSSVREGNTPAVPTSDAAAIKEVAEGIFGEIGMTNEETGGLDGWGTADGQG